MLGNYIDHHGGKALKHLHDYAKSGSAEDLHGLRVSLKKLRAAVKCVLKVQPSPKTKKAAKKLEKLFASAGKIRELQLMHKFLTENGLFDLSQEQKLEKKIARGWKKFREKHEIYSQKLQKIILHLRETVRLLPLKLVQDYAKRLRLDTETRLAQKPTADNWHDTRKMVKQYTYSLDWVLVADRLYFTVRAENFYNRFQQQIGDWHDATDMLARLNKYAKKRSPPQKLTPLLMQAEKLLVLDIEKQEKKIIASLRYYAPWASNYVAEFQE